MATAWTTQQTTTQANAQDERPTAGSFHWLLVFQTSAFTIYAIPPVWWGEKDSNLQNLVSQGRIALPTHRLTVDCSTE